MLLLKNGNVIRKGGVAPEPLDILIADGKIQKIGRNLNAGCKVLDLTGKTVFPGLIDMHVHLRDPGQTHKEDILSGCEAAAAGGVTAVLCMPNTSPPADSPEVISYIVEKGKAAKARVYPVGCITKGMEGKDLTDFASLKAAGAIAVSDDGKPVENAALMLKGMETAASLGLLVTSHCEDLSIIDHGIIHKGKVSEALGVKGMDRASEDIVTAREIALAESHHIPVHIAHVSTKAAVDMIRDAKKRGVLVSAETAPHYFSLTEDKLYSKDADYRMNPPLREKEDVNAVLQGVLDGTLDAIVTDHAPHTPEEKADFLTAPNGVVGMETSFSAAYTFLVDAGLCPIETLIDKMSTTPARLLHLPLGELKEGREADIAVADLSASDTVDPNRLHGKSKNAVFKGMTLKGKIVCTICRGQIVYQQLS